MTLIKTNKKIVFKALWVGCLTIFVCGSIYFYWVYFQKKHGTSGLVGAAEKSSQSAEKYISAGSIQNSVSPPAIPPSVPELRIKGDSEASQKIDAIQGLAKSVKDAAGLTQEQKDGILSDLDNEATTCTSLKEKLAREADLTLATQYFKAVEAINTSEDIVPRINLVLAAASQRDALSNLTQAISRIKDKIAEQKKDLSSTKEISDLEARLSSASDTAGRSLYVLSSLPSDAYPGDKATVQSYASLLRDNQQKINTLENNTATYVSKNTSIFSGF